VGTPSVFLSYILFIPIAAPQGINSIEQSALLVLVTALATVPVYFGIILIARQLKRVTLTPATSSLIGRITATVIGVTAVWILAA
jgi:threonine/homoserine/homoserine lactone efflux protein